MRAFEVLPDRVILNSPDATGDSVAVGLIAVMVTAGKLGDDEGVVALASFEYGEFPFGLYA